MNGRPNSATQMHELSEEVELPVPLRRPHAEPARDKLPGRPLLAGPADDIVTQVTTLRTKLVEPRSDGPA